MYVHVPIKCLKPSNLDPDRLVLEMLGKSNMKPWNLSSLLFHHGDDNSQRLVTCSYGHLKNMVFL